MLPFVLHCTLYAGNQHSIFLSIIVYHSRGPVKKKKKVPSTVSSSRTDCSSCLKTWFFYQRKQESLTPLASHVTCLYQGDGQEKIVIHKGIHVDFYLLYLNIDMRTEVKFSQPSETSLHKFQKQYFCQLMSS